MIEFESGMRELNFYNNIVELCKEFRSYVSDRLLSRSNIKYHKLTNNGENIPTLLEYNIIIKHIITSFRWTNILKHIKSYIMIMKKPMGVLQDDFLDQLMQVQLYL